MADTSIKTKYGTARLMHGHYRIDSFKEGNHNKYLHRLIWEDHYGKPVPKGYVIHHINGVKTDNRIQNLQCVEHSLHNKFHRKSVVFTDEIRKKISESHKGTIQSEAHCLNITRGKDNTGYYRVSKVKCDQYKRGYRYVYQFYENGKYRSIVAPTLDKLKRKVLNANLIWSKLEYMEAIQ